MSHDTIGLRLAEELGIRPQQVAATVALLDEGATVPFIARYRKEITGALDDTQLRTLEERLRYLREMEDRRAAILKSIEEQGKLTPQLRSELLAADSKTRLEDLYLPYKPKRRTKGQIAIEAGLEPLADALFNNPDLDPEAEAAAYISADKGVADAKAALLQQAELQPQGAAVQVGYINPETGASCENILGFSALMVRAGETIRLPKRSPAQVFHLIEGTLQIGIDTTRLDLAESDTCCAPCFAEVVFSNTGSEPAFVFIADEAPVQKKLGLYSERS